VIATSAWQIAAEHFFSFSFGIIVGFALTSRYRVVKRNGEDKP